MFNTGDFLLISGAYLKKKNLPASAFLSLYADKYKLHFIMHETKGSWSFVCPFL